MKDNTLDLDKFTFPSHLTLVFVAMKCMGYIDWSWWLVFSPIIVMGIFCATIIGIILTSR